MPIEFRCNQCDRLLRTPDGTSGKDAKCPQCGALVKIPEPSAPSSFVPPPPAPAYGTASYGAAPVETGNPYQSPSITSPEMSGSVQRGFHPTRIDLGDVLGRTWKIYKSHLWPLVGVTLLFFVCIGVSGGLVGGIFALIMDSDRPEHVGATNLVNTLINVFLTTGLMLYMLKTARGDEASVADLFGAGPYFLRSLGAYFLFGLSILIGFVLLIIPGIIVALMFSQYLQVILDQNTGVIDSLRYSARAASGNKLTLFALGLVAFFGGAVLTLLTCGIGALFVYPFGMLAVAVAYLAMTGQTTADQLQPDARF